MAIITPTRLTPTERNRAVTFVHTWSAMANGDTGESIDFSFLTDRSVQVSGTFGSGGAVAIEGTINGTDYAVLTDPQGNALSISTAKIETIMEAVQSIRPRVTAGDGTTSINVSILSAGSV